MNSNMIIVFELYIRMYIHDHILILTIFNIMNILQSKHYNYMIYVCTYIYIKVNIELPLITIILIMYHALI